MTDELENPPAFPQHSWQRIDKVEVGECLPGMTLRDYFAAAAMQGLLASGTKIPEREEYDGKTQGYCYADMAFSLADAMLKARAA